MKNPLLPNISSGFFFMLRPNNYTKLQLIHGFCPGISGFG